MDDKLKNFQKILLSSWAKELTKNFVRDLEDEIKKSPKIESVSFDTTKAKERLKTFFYVLLRDFVAFGEIERILKDHVEKSEGQKILYGNYHLEKYVDVLVSRIFHNGKDNA